MKSDKYICFWSGLKGHFADFKLSRVLNNNAREH